ncbi:SDR family NAD(P)-dependent oxidoreductase [Paenibacillus sp. MMS18-CY102]|nr:SDR family NAD(P)-dependent oxidoreductase [Paenibacillus sp. MMS18-CY102]MWC30722.1 SDR family NAD(P)-dependent oxidoreductase [Paenibacillus sp. MMS18-CY102]
MVALITGANSGVGLELTKRMLSEGWEVAALVRSPFPDDEPVIAEARQAGRLRIYRADLADFAQLREALQLIKSKEPRIDVLFNNAGVSLADMKISKQGREIHYEVNAVVPYIVLMELLPQLRQGRLKTVVNTSSNALLYKRGFETGELERPQAFKALFGPYASSKLALSLWTRELAASLLSEGIRIRSVCPGGNKTAMTANAAMPIYLRPIRQLFFSHPSKGAARVYNAAFGEGRERTGVFLNKGKATALPFAERSAEVLRKIAAVYEGEFQSESMKAGENGGGDVFHTGSFQ